jgi:hypothetical protein
MTVSVGPQGTLVMGTKTELITCMNSISETRAVNQRLLCLEEMRRVYFTRFPVSRLKEMRVVNPCLLYLDERAKFWSPPVSIGNGLLRCLLYCWHVCNRCSK